MTNFNDFFKHYSFNRTSPIYIQLAEGIEKMIQQGNLSSPFLPSERELAKQLSLSRVTVSKALGLLEQKRLISRQQGLGTRILSPLDYSLNQPLGFTERMEQRGYRVSNLWLNREKITLDTPLAERLHLPVGSVISYLKRVRLIDQLPVSIESTSIPEHFLPHPELLEGSLYLYWQQKNIQFTKKHFTINAVNCTAPEAKLLQQPLGTALLKITEISKDKQDNIMEVSETLCLGSHYAFEFDL